ncbi:MAG: hypothetical protein CVU80_01460 [Elusimicrobia bacterium HGW-Elusimicrobia-4]|nr:MAG: hypothetical protein CVU80_01460 [Elusimicrobia bacterium HGW-Elusimicrobia-4]
MSICPLCGKDAKKEINCRLLNSNICLACCFSISSGNSMMIKLRHEKGLLKEDILAKCTACIQEKSQK